MEFEDYKTRISEFSNRLSKLLSEDAITIHDLLAQKPSLFSVKGVYLINTPDDKEIAYVGMTKINNVISRIRDHRRNTGNSDLINILKNYLNYPPEIDLYIVRCEEVLDSKERAFFEHFAISILQPPFNK